MATQCPIPPGSTFTYEFKVYGIPSFPVASHLTIRQVTGQVGTYWWHAHVPGQTADGLRGPLIIHDPKPPYGKVDGELVMTVGDWYYSEAPYLINFYQSVNNTSGAEPIPESALLNEGQDVRV